MFARGMLAGMWIVAYGLAVAASAAFLLDGSAALMRSTLVLEILLLLVIVVGTVATMRRKISSRMFWELLMSACVYGGVWFMANLFLPIQIAPIAGAAILFLTVTVRHVWLSNLTFLLGCVGASLLFARWLPVSAAVMLLSCLTLFDVFVFGRKGVASTFVPVALERQFLPAFMLVGKWRDLVLPLDRVKPELSHFVSASELILILAPFEHVLWQSWRWGAVVAVLSMIGLLVGLWKVREEPRAAIPAMAIGTIAPVLLLWITHVIV